MGIFLYSSLHSSAETSIGFFCLYKTGKLVSFRVPLVDELWVLLGYCIFTGLLLKQIKPLLSSSSLFFSSLTLSWLKTVSLYLHFATSVIHEITTALGIYCFRWSFWSKSMSKLLVYKLMFLYRVVHRITRKEAWRRNLKGAVFCVDRWINTANDQIWFRSVMYFLLIHYRILFDQDR